MAAAPAARAPTPFRLAAPVDWAGVLVVDAAAALVAELAREEDDDDEAREVAEEAFELTMEEPDEATDEVAAAVVLEPEPEPASTQISVVMDEVSVGLLVMCFGRVTLEEGRTQCIVGRAASDNTRSGGLGDGVLCAATLADVVSETAPSAGDGVGQAGERASWEHGRLAGDGLRVGDRGQGEGSELKLHICGVEAGYC